MSIPQRAVCELGHSDEYAKRCSACKRITALKEAGPCQHMIGQRAIGGIPGHEHVHPTGPQVCLICGKTLDELLAAARDEGREVIEGIAGVGTVESFLALTDDEKRRWFALAIDESARRKEVEESLVYEREDRRLTTLPLEDIWKALHPEGGGWVITADTTLAEVESTVASLNAALRMVHLKHDLLEQARTRLRDAASLLRRVMGHPVPETDLVAVQLQDDASRLVALIVKDLQ